jgi:carbon-monoxide dehydrogenase medium subunit
LQAFDYVAAHSIEQVVSLLNQYGDGARVLSGGTDLIVQLRDRHRQTGLLVDIKQIPEVNTLVYDPIDGLQIGAAVPCYRIYSDPVVKNHYPGLVDAVSLIGGIQIQGRATLGGNLCNASPAADSIPALIALEGVCVTSGPNGHREIAVEDFCTAPGQTLLQQGEFLVSLHIPPPKPRSGAGYLRFTPRNEMDIAVVGVGASVVLDESGTSFESARIALGAVAPTPLFLPEAGAALNGKDIDDDGAIERAAQIARSAARPITDMRGTIAQRKYLSAVLTRRVLIRAVERARVNIRKE